MLIYGKYVACLDEQKDKDFLDSLYGVDFDDHKASLGHSSLITQKQAKIIAYIDYDGDIYQLFILDKEEDRVEIKKSVRNDGNNYFNSDGFGFFTLMSNGKQKRYVLQNSPFSFKYTDEDGEHENMEKIIENIGKLLKKENISLDYENDDILFLQEL